ncbi:MAG: hypothetical protein AAGD11_14035 [Planctomycetota bacterium]
MSIRSPRCRSLAAKFTIVALVAAFALVTSVKAQAQGSKMKPIAVVAINSINNIMDDVDFAGTLAGKEDLSNQVRPFVGMIQGLDSDQPIGLVLQSDGIVPGGAICVPCTNLKAMIDGMAMFGVTHEDGPNGTMQIGAQGQTVFAREADGWAYISMAPEMLDSLPADPAALLGALTKEYDIAIRLSVQNIPEAYKQMALSQLEAGMQAGMQKLDTETDEQFEARQEMAKVQVDQLKQAAQDLDELTLGVAVDSVQQRAYLDIAYTAVAGSKLAEQIAINADPKTDFAGFFQPDAAMMMSFASKVSESDVAQMEQMFGAMLKQVETAIDQESDLENEEDRQAVKSAVSDFMEALKSTMMAGKMDGGAVLNMSPTSLSFVAGGFVGDPAKVESGLKKLADVAKGVATKEGEDFPAINWNSGSHQDVQFHTVQIPSPDSEDEKGVRQMFGDTIDVAVGIGKESAYVAFGRDCLDALKRVMDVSAASPQKSVAPMEMTFSLSQIMTAVAGLMDDEENNKPMIEMMANMLGNEAKGRDHVRMVVQIIPNGGRVRIEVEEGVLRAIGMSAMAAQAEAAGAGGF